ncbi:MAG: hypothetical protein H6Q20_883 [Bacteroidetes bacterium]|jgi:hypothetical protein|nr:hypothetical protein [Bacteroidota bacterium]
MFVFFVCIVIVLSLLYYFNISRESPFLNIQSVALAVILFLVLFLEVTKNNDWINYTSVFNQKIESSDYLFGILSHFLRDYGYSFSFLYKIHIIIMAVLFVYFASRFRKSDTFIIICIYAILQFVPLSNQIRFYVAFALFLTASYELIVAKNKIIFGIFTCFSVMSHLTIILMFPFIFMFYRYNTEVYLKRILLWCVGFSVVFWASYKILIALVPQYTSYFDPKMISSFGGGLFNNFIWIFWFLFVIRTHLDLKKENSEKLDADLKYNFLYKLSLYSIIVLPVSTFIQIFCHRYIISSIIVWVAYLTYANNYKNNRVERIKSFSFLIILFEGTFIFLYLLPDFILGVSGFRAALEILKSNALIFP